MASVLHSPLPTSLESSFWYESFVDGCVGTSLKIKQTVYSDASPFQKIEVIDSYGMGRILLLAGTIVFTERDEYVYNEMIVHPALLSHPAPRTVCIIGGGDGGALREVLRYPGIEKVTVVEIDSMVTDTVRRFFPDLAAGFNDPRVELVFEDGYDWLKASSGGFDAIIVDSYDPGGPIQTLGTEDFFEVVGTSLREGGHAVFFTSSPELNRDKIRFSMRDLRQIFSTCRPYIAFMPSFPQCVCSFVLCSAQPHAPVAPNETLSQIAAACRYFNQDVMQGAFLLPTGISDSFCA